MFLEETTVKLKFILSATLFFLFSGIYGNIHEIKVPVGDRETIKKIGMLDILGAGIKDGYVFYRVQATPNELLHIPPYIRIKKVEISTAVEPSYATLDEIDMRIEQMPANKNGYASVFTIGNSVEGRVVKAIRVSAVKEPDESVPEILFVGLHHAREWISYEVPLSIAEFFLEYGDINPALNEILHSSVLWFIPALNPDGYLYSYETDRMWRNNRRGNPDGTYGVDLNRNYDSSWIQADYFHGTKPFSEPEAAAIRDFVLNGTEYGVNSIDGLITYHSYGQLILYPPGSREEPPENEELYVTVGTKMADLIYKECGKYYNTMQIKDLYPTFGEMTEWFMNVSGNKLSYTFELRPTFFETYGFVLPPEYIRDSVKENIAAAVYFIQHITTGQTDIDTDKNKDGILDAMENTSFDYECYIPEDDDDNEINDHDSDDPENDVETDIDGNKSIDDDEPLDNHRVRPKSSGCSMVI
jgi:carboxypeptidase T